MTFSYEFVKFIEAVFLNGFEVVFESLLAERIDHTQFIDEWMVEVSSAGFLAGDISAIKIDGVERSKNSRGINVVVFNKRTGMVEDSVAFDTHIIAPAHR